MRHSILKTILIVGVCLSASAVPSKADDKGDVKAEHGQIGNAKRRTLLDNKHPGAQWFPDAGLGLFLHWSICSVREMNISWPMIPGRKLAVKTINDPKEIERIVREMDFELDGSKPVITPLEYWKMAETFNPDHYHPEAWLQKAKDAGFTYVVMTTKHHDGFAMWPSKFGNFNTKNFMGGRDLVKDYVEAARKVGLKVGLYYSGPDWYTDQKFMDFFYYKVRGKNPGFPQIGPDLKPRAAIPDKKELEENQREYARIVKGQVEELLTGYGPIDVLWFDGAPRVPNARSLIPQERIRELQPGIVINTRMHGKGDFLTYERDLPETRPLADKAWAEFCNPWNGSWPHVPNPFKDLNLVLSDLVRCRAFGINYMLGIGPMANGDLSSDAYENIGKLKQWMHTHGEAVYATQRLLPTESASVPATAKGNSRYLYLIPEPGGFPENTTVTFQGAAVKPDSVTLLSDGKPIASTYSDGRVTIPIPKARAGDLVNVIKISFP